jgi:formate C-acetyltransferase
MRVLTATQVLPVLSAARGLSTSTSCAWSVDPGGAKTTGTEATPKSVLLDVAGFIKDHLTPYDGSPEFLARAASAKTARLWHKVQDLCDQERHKGGVLDVDVNTPSDITAFGPGFVDRADEVVVGLQTDQALKRAIKPRGGINTVKAALKAYGYELPAQIEQAYTDGATGKTHNACTFGLYTDAMKKARKSGILTGLPDGYGRGRIIGDYRRVPLYGVDALIAAKQTDLSTMLADGSMDAETLTLRDEVREQIRALKALKAMAASYGCDVGRPARGSREAVQWLYLAYLAAVKEQDGAAMSLGRIDAFLDIFFEHDLRTGALTEADIQELIDQLVIKLRMVRHLRTPEYNALFAGDPTWVTCALAGMSTEGQHMVTKTTYRMLNTLRTLSTGPEPNLTVLWDPALPADFKRYCAQVSLETSSIQYENDILMRKLFGDDYAIACCVSAMSIGRDMQYFGARANLPKLLLYVLNGGRDELSGEQIGPCFAPLQSADAGGPLAYAEVESRMQTGMAWLAGLYVNTMNAIHASHDRWCYERLQMALHDTKVRRLLAFGISGLSVVADSLSAIKHASVYPIRDARGLITDFRVEGDFPKYGNDDDAVDSIAQDVVASFGRHLGHHSTHRHSVPTLSVLTITSNVHYGKMTGSTPDGRKQGEPFAPGANPMHGREQNGLLASLNSVAKIPYNDCLDGISNTCTVVPSSLGRGQQGPDKQAEALVGILDGYFARGGQHININAVTRQVLEDAMEHPERYPHLTIRVSGYAVHWIKLTQEQQREVLARSFHGAT